MPPCHHVPPCAGCKIQGTFQCGSSMNIAPLLTEVGLPLLQWGKGSTNEPDKLYTEMDNLFNEWRSNTNEAGEGIQLDMTPNIHVLTPPKDKSQIEEELVLNSFRNQVEQMNRSQASFFPNFYTGPRVGKAKFGENLTSILTLENKHIFLNAFNLPDTDQYGLDLIKHLNGQKREHDLVVVLGALAHLLQIEVKGGRDLGNWAVQFRTFKEYMQQSHGGSLDMSSCNLNFVPVLARHSERSVGHLCDQYQFDIPSDVNAEESFTSWWQQQHMDMEAEPVDVIPLLKRMLLISSLVMTSLPQQLSEATPDSHLILLRKNQWELLAARPKYAILAGGRKTGKSMALELGLALLGQEKARILISLGDVDSIQNGIREDFFDENSGIGFQCYENMNGIDLETISRESIVAIDGFPVEDLAKPEVRIKLDRLMSKSKYLWIALEGITNPREEDLPADFTLVMCNM